MQLTQQMIDRLRQETDYLHARSTTIAVPLFVMKLVLAEAERGLTVGARCCATQTNGQAGDAQQRVPTERKEV